jgi:cyanophycinase
VAAKRLLAIGGAEDREKECEILKKFVELAGTEDAEILIMTIATAKRSRTIDEFSEGWARGT